MKAQRTTTVREEVKVSSREGEAGSMDLTIKLVNGRIDRAFLVVHSQEVPRQETTSLPQNLKLLGEMIDAALQEIEGNGQ
jgi:hypothetical protein